MGRIPGLFSRNPVLAESGRLKARPAELIEAVKVDPRLVLDDVSISILVQKALDLAWTTDPFDRFLAAHSLARRIPLYSADSEIQEHHPLIVPELR